MLMKRKSRKRKQTKPDPAKLKPIHVFLLIIGVCSLWFYAEVSRTVLPSPPTSGVGLVPVVLGNAGPDLMDVLITAETGQTYSVTIPRCPTCKVQTFVVPPGTGCPSDTSYKSFSLYPGRYKVDVLASHSTITYSSPLDLTDGKAYDRGTCFYRVQLPDRHRDLQEK